MEKQQAIDFLRQFIGKKIWVGVQTEFGIGKPPFNMELLSVDPNEAGIELDGVANGKQHGYTINESLLDKKVTLHHNGKGISFRLDRSSWLSISYR